MAIKYSDFQALPVLATNTLIAALSAGELFLMPSQEWQKGAYGVGNSQNGKGTDLRHKVHYQRKVDPIDAYGVTGPACGYVPQYDVLESDDRANETKTAVRRGQDTSAYRDDDDRRPRRILADPDWS